MSDEQGKEFTGLHTMISQDVFDELTHLAQQRKSFTGKWDYNSLFREMIYIFKNHNQISQRLMNLETEFGNLKMFVMEHVQETEDKKSEDDDDDNPLGLLGKSKKRRGKD